MRFSLAVAVLVAGISVSGVAQQNDPFRVKPSAPEKAPKSNASIAKIASPATASSSTSKDLQNLEHQTAKASAPPRSAGKKTPETAPALALAKDKPNPPINFGGTGGKSAAKPAAKTAGMTNQSANPLAGRLKQKHAHQ